MSSKKPGDVFADIFIDVVHKGTARALSAGAKLVQERVSRMVGDGLFALDRIASCNCTPTEVRGLGPDGVEELVTVHAKNCPARLRER